MRLHRLGSRRELAAAFPNAARLLTGTVDVALIWSQWDEMLRLAASLTYGYATASLVAVRSHVTVGADTLLGHTMSIERGTGIGARVRCSPGSHITSDTVIGDDVFLGAGVHTINDNGLDWRVGGGEAPLTPPRFDDGCRVGSGSVVLGGIRVGARALVGAGSVVTRDVAPDTVVFGNPAAPRSTTSPSAAAESTVESTVGRSR